MRGLIITSGGEALAARLVGGSASARFTKICASSADYSDREPSVLKELSELSEIRQSAAVSGTRRVDASTAEISAAMDNTAITEGYYTRTIGLYAEDQDKNEILFAVCTEPDSPFYMPPYAGATVSGISYKLRVKVSNSERIEIGASAEVYATALQLDEAVTRINDRIDALSFTAEINEHNENGASHPKLLERLDDIAGRLDLAEIAISGEITSNPFSVTFGDLNGITADGVWIQEQSKLEF